METKIKNILPESDDIIMKMQKSNRPVPFSCHLKNRTADINDISIG
jgi:hypothetical protein